MFTEYQNSKSHLKDDSTLPVLYSPKKSYTKFSNKTNKLVTALYMVTDIMDKDEPLRSKLRILGTNIVSDTYEETKGITVKIDEVLSFLEIGATLGMISPMNHSILKKEFIDLRQSILESEKNSGFWGDGKTLSDFIKEEPSLEEKSMATSPRYIGHVKQARIGVQKGSTLMKALSDRIPSLSDTKTQSHDVLKKNRQDEIIKIIRSKGEILGANFNGLTITDIRTFATGPLTSCGEKTIQRELVSMVKENVLKKSGSKRWSRYFLNTP